MNSDHTDHVKDVKYELSILCWVRYGRTERQRYHFCGFCRGSANDLPHIWRQDVWLTLIHSLIVARPKEDKVRDEILPDQMHEVVWN